jgi:hypothetical protein
MKTLITRCPVKCIVRSNPLKKALLLAGLAAALSAVGAPALAQSAFQDLTPGVASASTYTFDGQLSGASSLTNQNFINGLWITDSTNPHWAQYAFGGSKYVGYVLLGGNVNRVPDYNRIQYTTAANPSASSTWITVDDVPAEGGSGMNYLAVNKTATAIRVLMQKTSAPNPYTDLEAMRVYGNSDLTSVGRMNTTASATMLSQATISLAGTWENNLGGTSVLTHLTNTLVPGDSIFRGNGDLATKPVLQMSWGADKLLSGVDIASRLWSAGGGNIVAMNVDALPTGLDPALASASDWFTVASYNNATAASRLIHLQFDNGSLATRGLRLVLTDVGDSSLAVNRRGGDISELILAGGVLAVRTFTSPSTINLGRVLIGASPVNSGTVMSTGLAVTTANSTLQAYSGSAINGLSLTGGNVLFNGETTSAAYSLSGSVTGTAGNAIGGTFNLNAVDDFGNTVTNAASVVYTGTAYDAASISKVQTGNVGNGGAISVSNASGAYRSAAFLSGTTLTGQGWSVTGFGTGTSAAAGAALAGTAHFDGTGRLSGIYTGTFSATFQNDQTLVGAGANDLGGLSWSLYENYVNTSGSGSTTLAANIALSTVSLTSGTGAGATVASFAAGSTGVSAADVAMSFTSGTAGQYSNILSLHGTDGLAQVLQLTYDPSLLGGASEESLLLGWLDTRIGSATNGEWINSVLGNTGNLITRTSPYLGSWADYVASTSGSATAANSLGAFGVDTTTNTVWAAINHNSQFVVIVPEPGALALAGIGIAAAAYAYRRRRS